MSTVAFDGTRLAADRQATFGCTPMLCRKVYRVRAPNGRRALVGYTGSGSFVRAHLHWLAGGDEPDFSHTDFKWSILMIDDSGAVWFRADSSNYWDRLRVKRFAIGSGADYALGAMAHGADARDAVRVACSLDVGSGLGVDVVSFKGR